MFIIGNFNHVSQSFFRTHCKLSYKHCRSQLSRSIRFIFFHILGVRLAGANNDPFQGLVEVFQSGSWRKVCGDTYWDLRDANVVCRQLGFAGAFTTDKTRNVVWRNGEIRMTRVRCTGNEKSLTECHSRWSKYSFSNFNCGHDAWVFCISGMSIVFCLFVCFPTQLFTEKSDLVQFVHPLVVNWATLLTLST